MNYYPHAINEHVLTREKTCINQGIRVRGAVDARLLIMFVTRNHAKHVLNYEYLNAARILHSRLA